MRVNIKKSTYEEMKHLADIRGQTMAEFIDDVWERFEPTDLLLRAETVKRLRTKMNQPLSSRSRPARSRDAS